MKIFKKLLDNVRKNNQLIREKEEQSLFLTEPKETEEFKSLKEEFRKYESKLERKTESYYEIIGEDIEDQVKSEVNQLEKKVDGIREKFIEETINIITDTLIKSGFNHFDKNENNNYFEKNMGDRRFIVNINEDDINYPQVNMNDESNRKKYDIIDLEKGPINAIAQIKENFNKWQDQKQEKKQGRSR